MQAAVVHILLLHSCTVVCNLHCLYYSHFCKLILLYVTLLFTNKLAPWYQVSMRFRNLLLTNQITRFLTAIL